MADQLIIRNLPESLKPALKRRAAANGRSMEAEARSILVDVVFTEDPVLCWLDEMASAPPGDELLVPERGPAREPVVFE